MSLSEFLVPRRHCRHNPVVLRRLVRAVQTGLGWHMRLQGIPARLCARLGRDGWRLPGAGQEGRCQMVRNLETGVCGPGPKAHPCLVDRACLRERDDVSGCAACERIGHGPARMISGRVMLADQNDRSAAAADARMVTE